ncbi:MAG: ACT domain-containing protein [Planctomycetes bacterium]|jgi:ACT domain-containing protein|nr:ACT domain-containing protein [Planctomycetota bacterium]
MARRFLTAEDVRSAKSREIVVDEQTLVTPQAQEAAAAAGISIRAGGGAWVEPKPDRGPDAERAQRALPNLPEPAEGGEPGGGAVITAVGKNRAGVLAELTSALAQAGVSVHDISQRVVDGYFHLILVVELDPGTSFGPVKQRLECLGGPEDYAVRVMHQRVFRYMHRV